MSQSCLLCLLYIPGEPAQDSVPDFYRGVPVDDSQRRQNMFLVSAAKIRH